MGTGHSHKFTMPEPGNTTPAEYAMMIVAALVIIAAIYRVLQ